MCSSDHIILVTDDNDVFAFGKNQRGQLGFEPMGEWEHDYMTSSKYEFNPIKIMEKTSIRQIACGSAHTIILLSNNDIWVSGDNTHGQLGLNRNISLSKLVKLEISDCIDSAIREIVCGSRHTFIIKENNDVIAFGENTNGQLGLGHDKKSINQHY